MLKVVHLFFLISHTMSCFCLGVTRQQIIDLHELTSCNNLSYSLHLRRSSPVTTKQHSLPSGYCIRSTSTSSTESFHFTRAMSSAMRPHDMPILMAVSFLSPVSIHTLTPAYRSLSIVNLTLSCNLSYMAVAPMISNYFSMISSKSLVLLDVEVCSSI